MAANARHGTSEPIGRLLRDWVATPPVWRSAEECQRIVARFLARTDTMSLRFGQPLVVAMLGGSGTGKSSLVNALLGASLVTTGRDRPTTTHPTIICHPRANITQLLRDCDGMEIVRCDQPLLERVIIIDCPDPDTTEENTTSDTTTNLAWLRRVLPQCELLLVTGTQQKYRSDRVWEELSLAAPGVRLVFVQTHRDRDENIIDDWQRVLSSRYETGRIFCVDSINALVAQQNGDTPDDEFLALRRLLSEELTSDAARSLRDANYLDLAADATARCRTAMTLSWSSVEKLRDKIASERLLIGERTAIMMRDELMRDRRLMESRLIGRIAIRWGYSPFSLLLRGYQGLGGLVSSTLLVRARSVPQLAVWGVLEGARSLRKWRDQRRGTIPRGDDILIECEEANLRAASLIIAGFAEDAHLPTAPCNWETVQTEAGRAGSGFVTEVARSIDAAVDDLAGRFNSIFFRTAFEAAFSAMLLFLIARPAKNFFWDTVVTPATPLLGTDYYLVSLFWLLLWGGLLLGMFILAMRSGLERKIGSVAKSWSHSDALMELFATMTAQTQRVARFRDSLDAIDAQRELLAQVGNKIDSRLGRRKG